MAVLLGEPSFPSPPQAGLWLTSSLLLPQATSGPQLQGKAPGSLSRAFSAPVHLLGHRETTSASPFIKLPPVAVLQWELAVSSWAQAPTRGSSWGWRLPFSATKLSVLAAGVEVPALLRQYRNSSS